jgi:ParB/RepB/Spo0J family partition protein
MADTQSAVVDPKPLAERTAQGKLMKIRIADIRENPDALRQVDRRSEGYLGLVESIREKGLLKPINVREMPDRDDPSKTVYSLVDGAHRYTASQDAGLEEIPAYVLDVSEAEALEAQLVANAHVIETKPSEYSDALLRMLGLNPTLTVADLAKKLSKSPKWLGDRLSINKLDPEIKKLVDENKVNLTNAYSLAKLKDYAEQREFLDRAMTEQPAVFVPLVQTRVKELNDAKRQGRNAAAEQYTPVAHPRKGKEMEEEIGAGRAAQTLKGQGHVANPQDFLMGVKWALHLDPQSVEEGRVKWEQQRKDREENKRKAKIAKAQKQQQEASKILAEMGQNGQTAPQEASAEAVASV